MDINSLAIKKEALLDKAV